MKEKIFFALILGLGVMMASYGQVWAHGPTSGGGRGSGPGSMYFPGLGPAGSGGGMMGSGGGMMGSGGGMMGPGGSMMGGSGWDQMGDGLRGLFGGHEGGSSSSWRGEHEVNEDQARRIIEYRLGDNPYLRIGNMNELRDGFEFEIVTKKGGELVDRQFVERNTGHTYSMFDR